MRPETPAAPARSRLVTPWVFATLLLSDAFFWHTRDWNAASRLMLTYAIADRGTVSLDGLERQTGDRASFQGHAYSDKLPGFSLLAAAPYALAKVAFGLPDHPLDRPGFPLWRADYWTTLATTGLATAGSGALLAWWASALGCGPKRSALVGLAYGLATPAYVYATLAYGHQLSAFALLSSFTLIEAAEAGRRAAFAMALAGFAAAIASLIDLQVAPVSALLGLYAVIRAIFSRPHRQVSGGTGGLPTSAPLLAASTGGQATSGTLGQGIHPTESLSKAARGRRSSWVAAFAIGALPPSLTLLGYNLLAFGSPFDMGYFHHAVQRFRDVHSTANPLGLRWPRADLIVPLLVGRRRGLLLFAPILLLAPPGWAALARGRRWGVAIVSALACAAIFAVNLSYPEWTGGWSTGPRLLVPLLPFAMLPVAGLLAIGGRGIAATAAALALLGAALMLMCQGVDGRIPEGFPDPLLHPVLSTWRGDPLPWGPPEGEKPGWTPVGWIWSSAIGSPPPAEWWLQFAPLVGTQAVLIGGLWVALRISVRRPPA